MGTNEKGRRNGNMIIGIAFIGIGLILSCIFYQFMFFSYFSIVLFALLCYLIYSIRPKFYIKYLAFVFMSVALIVGLCAIEFGDIYLTELRKQSAFAGSIPLMTLSYSVFFLTLFFADKDRARNAAKLGNTRIFSKKEIYPKYMLILTWISLLIYMTFWVRVIRYPAFILNVNRFAYARLYAPKLTGIWNILNSISSILLLFPIVSFIKGYRVLGISTVSAYCLYCLWIGNKFGTFFTLLCLFFLILYPSISGVAIGRLKKWARIGLAALALVVALSFFIQNSLGDNVDNYFVYRVSGQGQLWWEIFKDYKEIHISEIGDEIYGILYENNSVAENIGSNYGIYKIMYLCAPKSVVDSKLSGGSRYTEAGFAAANYYLSVPGCILFAVVMGLIICKILNGFIDAISAERYFRALLFLRLYVISQTALSMFIFSGYFDIVSIFSYLFFTLSGKRARIINIGGKFKIKI